MPEVSHADARNGVRFGQGSSINYVDKGGRGGEKV